MILSVAMFVINKQKSYLRGLQCVGTSIISLNVQSPLCPVQAIL
jgi:hypothetical protein